MLSFLSLHLGTILVGLIVLAGVTGIIVHLIRNKRKGKCVACDSGCGGCQYSSECHTE